MSEMGSDLYTLSLDDFSRRIEVWKNAMRKKCCVPAEYQIAMPDSDDNDIDSWMAYCGRRNAVLAKRIMDEGAYWFFGDGHKEYCPSQYEYFVSLVSNYKLDKNDKGMSQDESDVIAHFIQVVSVLQNSSWCKKRLVFQSNINGDHLQRGDMPSLEETIFAILYIRQLICDAGNDDLLNTASNFYLKHVADNVKVAYVKERKKEWNHYLKEEPQHVVVAQKISSNWDFIESFAYGALIIHSPHKVTSSNVRAQYKQLYLDKENRTEIIFNLNCVMKELVSMASRIAVLIQNDFVQWINEEKIPKPDVMWQQDMFRWLSVIDKCENPSLSVP